MNASRLVVVVAAIALFASVRWMAADSWSVSTPEKPFQKALLKAAAEYERWQPADDAMRWAPASCWAPRPGPTAFSASADWSTHGQKLYALFARERDAYRSLRGGDSVEIGQVVVKQSWLPEEVTDQSERAAQKADEWEVIRVPDADGKRQHAYVLEDGLLYPLIRKGEKVFKAARRAELFIMMKLDPETPNTDAGWVYGTVTPDGRIVTSAGKVQSCMECHKEAKNERLFGLTRPAPPPPPAGPSP
jgi:hypothetical protein